MEESAVPLAAGCSLLLRSIMRSLVVLALALCCNGQIAVPYIAAPYPLAIKYQGVDAFGQTTFGHQALDQTRHEVRLADGRVIGQYSFIDSNGEPAVTYFEAGPNGYRVLGSNVLPEGPAADYVPEYSEDVARAREEFLAIFEEARKGNLIPPAPVEVPAAPAPTLAAEKPAEEAPAPPAPEAAPAEGEKAAEEFTAKEGAEEPVAEPAAAEGEVAAEKPVESARRRRDVARFPLPYLHAVPTETKATIETKQFEPVDAATPADTKKIALTTKEHTFTVPGFKYVQPTVEVKPVQYNLLAPQVAAAPYAHPFYPGFGYPLISVAAPPAEEKKE
ncbi:fibrous sheath CABYR-binding protein-like [Macrobrachium rosenbergii]|uniref:fibrous sheath CABYR-binding protein-like n=1 Tax=Macrobrachium rosenbergii TaxID=79674 RepID=UPI0034D4AD50